MINKLFFRKSLQKTLVLAKAHKALSTIGIIVVLGSGWWGYRAWTGTSVAPRYVLASVQKGTIITTVTGTGQVSASNQVDIKPKVSGDVVYVGVQNGQEVGAGTLLVELDARDAQKAVRDAEVNLESAKLSLEKLKKPADNLSLIQSENALAKAKESQANTQDNLKRAYEDGFNLTSNAFLDLPTVITGLQDILYSRNAGLGGITGQRNIDYYAGVASQYDSKADQFKDNADQKYQAARKAYDQNFLDYKATSRSSDEATIAKLIDQTYETTKSVAEAVKSASNLIQFYEDKLTENNLKPLAAADTHLTSLNTYTGKTNTHLTNLLGAQNTLKDDKTAIVNADRTIQENTESLAKLKKGADTLDIQSSELTLKQRENSLHDAQEKLADYFIRAPFDGTVAKLSVKRGDSVSSSAVATFITRQKLAEISLNEIDVAKIKVGEKVTLTFDAVEGLSISGQVAEIDTVGTVTQGVVTYSIKIGFDTQDERIKSGMSVSASIITDVKQDVLSVPNSAVKTQGNTHYVEMFDTPLAQGQGNQGVLSSLLPRQQPVEIGLSNDTATEITSGLKEGDQIVARTITATTATTQQQAPSLFGGGNRTGGGGGVRGGLGR